MTATTILIICVLLLFVVHFFSPKCKHLVSALTLYPLLYMLYLIMGAEDAGLRSVGLVLLAIIIQFAFNIYYLTQDTRMLRGLHRFLLSVFGVLCFLLIAGFVYIYLS